MPTITFGTSGWRAFLADEFTYNNVRIATQAIAEHLKASRHAKKGVLVSYDPRFLGRRFAQIACEVLAGNGIKSYLTDRDTPTPVVAWEQIRRKLDGAINFTASHNPPEYGGLKFNPYWGGPATKDITKDIEKKAAAAEAKALKGGIAAGVKSLSFKDACKKGFVTDIAPMAGYLKAVSKIVNLRAIKKAKLKVVVDGKHGAGRGYADEVLRRAGAQVIAMNMNADPLFGGGSPEPAEGHIDEMVRMVQRSKSHLGVGMDGDADRFGIVDSDGTFIPPNLVLALLVHHLHRTRPHWKGAVIRSVVSSHFIDAVAKLHGRELVEVPVGFKWIGEYMQKKDILVGGEESGGLTVHRHVPEKDGPLACLLMAEMRAVEGRPFKAVLADLYKQVGLFVVGRANFRLSEARKAALVKQLAAGAPASIAGSRVAKHITLDGHKFVLEDGAWLGIRFSGTEPVVRLYLEANSDKRLKQLREAGAKLIEG
jgi:alpha-D-glucose phosphate-specific phosphoglucomutase